MALVSGELNGFVTRNCINMEMNGGKGTSTFGSSTFCTVTFLFAKPVKSIMKSNRSPDINGSDCDPETFTGLSRKPSSVPITVNAGAAGDPATGAPCKSETYMFNPKVRKFAPLSVLNR